MTSITIHSPYEFTKYTISYVSGFILTNFLQNKIPIKQHNQSNGQLDHVDLVCLV